jgi:hypothetical protein
MSFDYIANQDHIRRRVAAAERSGQMLDAATALQLAAWLCCANGPGLQIFVATGVVTDELYDELARLYDLRQPEVERWLDQLSRFVMAGHVLSPEDWRKLRQQAERL